MSPGQNLNRCERAELACAYALQALPASEIAAAEAHIASCPDCQRELDSLRPVVNRFVFWPTDLLRPTTSLQTRLARRNAYSPGDGTIEQIYYRPGETVPAGRPVLALLPPGNLKLRFFAPQAVLPEIKYGDIVSITCDGCEKGLTAKVSFIARSAEYTPPVIYSQEERAKLVFLIEARPEQPEKFRVGQPVTVTLPRGPRQ